MAAPTIESLFTPSQIMPISAGMDGSRTNIPGFVTTVNANMLMFSVAIYRFIPGNDSVVSSISCAGLTFTRQAGSAGLAGGGTEGVRVEVWTAPITTPLTNEAFAITLSVASDDACAFGMGFIDAGNWDPGSMAIALPVGAGSPSSGSAPVQTTIDTTNPNDIVLFFMTQNGVIDASFNSDYAQAWSAHIFAGSRPIIVTLGTYVPGATLTNYVSTGTLTGSANTWAILSMALESTAMTTVPNVVGETLAQATTDITGAGLVVGTVTTATDPTVPVGDIISQSPAGGTSVALGSGVSLVESLGPAGSVPDIIGLDNADAVAAINAAGFTVGAITPVYGPGPSGIIVSQSPTGGSSAPLGSPISAQISNGVQPLVMPNVVGESQAQALSDISSIGVVVFAIFTEISNVIPAGIVISQTPPPGTVVFAGSQATITVSKGPFVAPLVPVYDPTITVISQYANSPTILQLVQNMAEYLRQDVNMETFFNYVWNVETAVGFGLDFWGRVVDISRLLHIPNSAELFGFNNPDTPVNVTPFNFGVFNSRGGSATQTYLLPDDAYRILILAKALSNISATTAPAINQILRNLFPGRGNAFVVDLGGMRMQYTFQFVLTVVEAAIIGQSNALPHGAGVAVSIISGGPGQGLGGPAEGPDIAAGVGSP